MEETPSKSSTMWKFVRLSKIWIIVVLLLLSVVVPISSAFFQYQRELQIAKRINANGGIARFDYFGPTWIPLTIRNRTDVFNRVSQCELVDSSGLRGIPLELVQDIKGLTKLRYLSLYLPKAGDAELDCLKGLTNLRELQGEGGLVTDAGMEKLKTLTNLESLHFSARQMTDDGIRHLKGLTKLRSLRLIGAEFTDKGLEHLQGMVNLTRLSLFGTGRDAQSGTLVSDLRICSNCLSIDLRSNRRKCQVPDLSIGNRRPASSNSICHIRNSTTLDLHISRSRRLSKSSICPTRKLPMKELQTLERW